ncbi:MAG: hypothetical protein JRJ39_11190 [Deltaproteobacteria bacterium]|nr:hypothetical protein [Deltaproteobacteria bacterium]MBW1814200.1 hypothetical protein [Deltaproteobacteria bacterium]MBW1848522.1 hypothetical protein [Deltaproteobacteria bacterium]
MATSNDKQIDQLIEEISSIKSIINKNTSLLRQVLLPAHFRLLALFSGISIILFSMIFYYFMNFYGGYSFMPGHIKMIIFGAIVVDWILLAVMKYSNFMKPLLKIDGRYTLGRLMKEFFSFRIVHVYVPLIVLAIFLCVYLLKQNSAYYIIPTISITIGLFYNFLGSIIEVKQWLLTGYWFLVTGLGVLVFSSIPAPVAVSISMGCGMLLFALPMTEG